MKNEIQVIRSKNRNSHVLVNLPRVESYLEVLEKYEEEEMKRLKSNMLDFQQTKDQTLYDAVICPRLQFLGFLAHSKKLVQELLPKRDPINEELPN